MYEAAYTLLEEYPALGSSAGSKYIYNLNSYQVASLGSEVWKGWVEFTSLENYKDFWGVAKESLPKAYDVTKENLPKGLRIYAEEGLLGVDTETFDRYINGQMSEEEFNSTTVRIAISLALMGRGKALGLGEREAIKAELTAIKGATFSELRQVAEFLKQSGLNSAQRREVIEAFNPGADVLKLKEDLVVKRYYGGTADPRGRWVTTEELTDPINQLALPPGNTAINVSSWTIPKGTEVLKGQAAPNFGRLGGAEQIFVPNLNKLIPY
jgi:hypothetical protein